MQPLVFCFNGPPGSGKDTGASLLNEILRQSQPKDTISIFFVPLAAPLKEACHALLSLPRNYKPQDKDALDEAMLNYTPRRFYINMSESLKHSKYFAPTLLGHLWINKVKLIYLWAARNYRPVLFITDCGFDYELEPIVKYIGAQYMLGFNLYRDGCSFANDSRDYINFATMGMQYAIFQNDSSLEDYKRKLAEVTGNFLKRHGLSKPISP